MSRIVHIFVPEKFMPPLINLVQENFPLREHYFLVGGRRSNARYGLDMNKVVDGFGMFAKFRHLSKLYKAEKIFLHGLYESQFLYLLALQPWLLKKCIWRPWGHDLYQYESKRTSLKSRFKEFIRAFVIRRLGHIVHYIPGDYELAKRWYRTSAKFHECLGYLSNTVKSRPLRVKRLGCLVIQVGNSAYPSNAHIDALEKIASSAMAEVKVIAPLSYGPREEAERVAAHGKARLGDRFIPLFDFVPLEKYLGILDEVDIGFFNQSRQQAMGNMITLLGMGKTLYLRRQTSSWDLFERLGITVKDVENFDWQLISEEDRRKNMETVAKYFSKKRLIEQYEAIFSYD